MTVTVTITTTCECCGGPAAGKELIYDTIAALVDYPRQFTKQIWGVLSSPRGETLPAVYCDNCSSVDHRLRPIHAVIEVVEEPVSDPLDDVPAGHIPDPDPQPSSPSRRPRTASNA